MSKVWDRRPFEYDEINVMEAKREKWKALYEFDTPVVHIDATEENNHSFETTAAARKLMHRFSAHELESTMDETMKAT
ncbi:hypothetical protein LTR37_003825 [Vermiconidia calcicola]|uniref:Uncharacterized protein n=1 Tax=Vermiconidia calcicola TaxID=1690605 RepID=A0ACC3NRR4_9PEZI|nr:hypothetical protein LTR37_003825 [Vermiconidia calcicola]